MASGSRVVQVCVQDHSAGGYRPPHVHIQMHFADRTRSPWLQLNHVTLAALRAAIAS